MPSDIQVAEDVRDESSKCGNVEAMALPIPPASVSGGEPGRVYIKFTTSDQCQAAKDMFDGRQFDGNTISAKFVSDEDFLRAAQGEWVMPRSAGGLPPPPGDFGALASAVIWSMHTQQPPPPPPSPHTPTPTPTPTHFHCHLIAGTLQDRSA